MGNGTSRPHRAFRCGGRKTLSEAYSNVDHDDKSLPAKISLKMPLPMASDACATCCQFNLASTASSPVSTTTPPSYSSEDPYEYPALQPEVLDTIDAEIDRLSGELREISLFIWDNPELAFEEHKAHDRLVAFMVAHGFRVTPHYRGLATAWRAEFGVAGAGTTTGGGRVIGLQSEMDALPKMGHACGHNLIAVSGIAVALGLKAAMVAHGIAGRIVLLGTPAEEHGGGKIQLLERGGYDDMDVCLMTHPGPGEHNSTIVSPWTAIQNVDVEYQGRSAHAAYAPWEAQNALDAAFMAYSGISVLRQQMKPSHRVHGIVSGNKDYETNVIPDFASMKWGIRAPTWSELEILRDRVVKCLEAAATATSCEAKITIGVGYKDCKENGTLADEYTRVAHNRYGWKATVTNDVLQASTDAGNISYVIPTIEPVFAIPTEQNGSNHTPQFATSAKSPAAHAAALTASKCLAATAARVLVDDDFFHKIRASFETQLAVS